MTHICVGKLNNIGSDNGLSPGRRQAIIWTNARILSIRPLATNFNEILIGIQEFSFKKMYLKMSSVKSRPFCLGLNVLTKNNFSRDPRCVTAGDQHLYNFLRDVAYRWIISTPSVGNAFTQFVPGQENSMCTKMPISRVTSPKRQSAA